EPGESDTEESGSRKQKVHAVSLGEELSSMMPELGNGAALWHWQQLRDHLVSWHERKYTLVACCEGDGEKERLQEMLKEDPKTAKIPVEMIDKELDAGLLLSEQKLVLLSDKEIFGRKSKVRRHRVVDYRQDQSAREITDLEDGAMAVHISYGLCIYHGIKRTESMGELIEAIELEFADDARLFVPLDQAYLVSRYMGGSKHTQSLSKMGGVAWNNSKNKAANAAWDLAAELLRLEAIREQSSGIEFTPQIEWERAFDSSFPYNETADQMAAIDAVLHDMENKKPMDRLICGDVGYGKTEVAMRAAFRAVMNGKQVALLVPTTVLAEQHYQSFRERMTEFPINIEVISRFRTHKEQTTILRRVELGEVDILIGTHRILQKDVHIPNLGLLVIDEEQRFGVKHKQYLKSMRMDVDILTMTATPIPRTLYFSLSGLRNLSTIMTAPTDRIPVVTTVAYFDKELIRQAILRELERKGQVFFLYNRVGTIYQFLQMLQKLVPEARFCVGHGRMKPRELEKVMTDFVEKKFDVLLCTTIIESGIDIPNVNTIIIDRADRFGLSELYQLRGRVGRYHWQAYAYLLLPPMGVLPENARQRLQAIRRYTHLGAGFKLAMKDLEIRGVGNILGEEQSGHIAAVGFELYCQLLKESVAKLEKKEIPVMRQIPVSFDKLTFSLTEIQGKTQAGIPVCYIQEEVVRVECYKRLSLLMEEKEVDQFGQELTDRFGTLPASVEMLVELYRIKVLARKAKTRRLNVKEGRLIIELPSGLLKRNNKVPQLKSEDLKEQMFEVAEFLREITNF
ncbi:MAG: transcription-repair coupling factor, partial [Lentisphaeria bacterium]